MSFRTEPSTDPEAVVHLLEERLYAHNAARTGRDDGRLFAHVVKATDGTLIGGVAGWTWAGICEVTQLWVDTVMRQHGIGSLLLNAAEAEAHDRGCRTILLRSYSFQAPAFYTAHGYVVEHVLAGHPEGHDLYTLVKRITQA